MPLTLNAAERAALQAAQAHNHAVRHWRRYQAVLLRADGVPVATVAQTLDCTETSVYNWVAAWRADGIAGVAEGVHPGKVRQFDAAAEAVLGTLLTEGDPQAYDSVATGRTLHRLGWRWKRPTFVLGRPDPAYTEEKAVAEQAAAVVAAGGEVWFGDETTLREFPPLRAGWARHGQQQMVVIWGRNARRVVHGALNVATGELVTLVRERSRQDDCVAFIEALGQVRPEVPKPLV